MSDPISLAFVGGTAVAEGIRFLYDLAGSLLSRRRERAAAGAGDPGDGCDASTVTVALPHHALQGDLGQATADLSVLAEREDLLRRLAARVALYASGDSEADLQDADTRARIEELRRELELALDRGIVLEERSKDAALLRAQVRAQHVRKGVTGIQAGRIAGAAEADLDVNDVEGDVIGIRVHEAGPAQRAGE